MKHTPWYVIEHALQSFGELELFLSLVVELEIFQPDGEWDRTEWTNDKFSEKFQNEFSFPNLPWLRDGDVKITQSSAIFKVSSSNLELMLLAVNGLNLE